nr:Gfo/Idh/MocA family oxidoreductase [Gammaproteobacteria bacterium]
MSERVDSEFRGALIGCGFFAENHMHAWRDIDNVQIVAICDTDPARLAAVGEQFNVERRYDSAEKMFELARLAEVYGNGEI